MLSHPKGVRPRLLAVVAVLVAMAGWVVQRLVGGSAQLATASWLTVVLLAAMSVVVYAAGIPVRRFLEGKATRPLNPLQAARTLVLAQAAALTGAAVLGWYAAQAAVLVPDADIGSQRVRMWPVLASAALGLALAVAGMLVQRMCRLDDDQRGPRDPLDREDGPTR